MGVSHTDKQGWDGVCMWVWVCVCDSKHWVHFSRHKILASFCIGTHRFLSSSGEKLILVGAYQAFVE